MTSICKDIPIDAPAVEVWDAVADFGALHTRLVPGFVVDTQLEDGARIVIPAELPTEIAESMRALALRAFHAVDSSGLARVDFFLERGTNRVLVNEINTMPGFTRASQYPRLWEATGVPLPALVERLVALALERHAARGRRRLSFKPSEPVSEAPRSSRGDR